MEDAGIVWLGHGPSSVEPFGGPVVPLTRTITRRHQCDLREAAAVGRKSPPHSLATGTTRS
ncbi:hypothetical protein FM106_05435 [Brachybacterium faecium]|nr:hypothetical protein FM106_05435 [Brachybacterium faecium]